MAKFLLKRLKDAYFNQTFSKEKKTLTGKRNESKTFYNENKNGHNM